jgi:hypothetical protein
MWNNFRTSLSLYGSELSRLRIFLHIILLHSPISYTLFISRQSTHLGLRNGEAKSQKKSDQCREPMFKFENSATPQYRPQSFSSPSSARYTLHCGTSSTLLPLNEYVIVLFKIYVYLCSKPIIIRPQIWSRCIRTAKKQSR